MSKLLYFVSSLNFGGAEKQTVLDANLMAGDHQVHLISFNRGPLIEILDSKVSFFQMNRSNYLKSAKELATYCRKHNIEIIHSALFAAFIISALSSLYCSARVIWHFHSHEYDMPLKSRIVLKLGSWIPGVKKLAFVNKELIEYFKKFRFPKHKVALLYNHSTVVRSAFERKDDGIIRIGYLGRVIKLKRVHYLIDLAQSLSRKGFEHFEIHVVGNGEEWEALEKDITRKGLASFFVLHGFQTDVNSFYETFDFFVNPSEEECLSIAMIDAGMHALPIVGFDVGGNNEIIRHGETGYVVQTLKEFVDACTSILANKELRKAMGQKSQEHCCQYFSEEVHRKEFEALYNEILS